MFDATSSSGVSAYVAFGHVRAFRYCVKQYRPGDDNGNDVTHLSVLCNRVHDSDNSGGLPREPRATVTRSLRREKWIAGVYARARVVISYANRFSWCININNYNFHFLILLQRLTQLIIFVHCSSRHGIV